MTLPDVNVLIYAFRPDSPDHERYRDWLHEELNAGPPLGVSPQVCSSVVRICTHPRIPKSPDPLEDVLAFCDALLTAPNARVILPGPHHWSIFQDLCVKSGATGNLVPDAWFAALAIESGCEWITADQDYARFPGLAWRKPW